MNIQWTAAALAATLMLSAGGSSATERPKDAEIDQAVIAELSALYGIHSTVIAHVDLTEPFDTKSQWTLVIGKQPDSEGTVLDGGRAPEGAVSVCFAKSADLDCSEAMFLPQYQETLDELRREFSPAMRPFYELFASQVVHSAAAKTGPLLWIKTCTIHGGNGSCAAATFLFAYDRKTDGFRRVFFNVTGRNNNQATRFVESGPLLGDIVVDYPTDNAPYAYRVEVYKPNADGEYVRILRYRGKTRYDDGNPLSVIDSEMPEILRRFGLWNAGDALPVPPTLPQGCRARLVMRKGVEWCEPQHRAELRPK